MRVQRISWDGSDPDALAARLRAQAPAPAAIAGEVADLIAGVIAGGDARLRELIEKHDGIVIERIEVGAADRARALGAIPPELREALESAAANIRAVADAQVAAAPIEVSPGAGQIVTVTSVPVDSAGIYVPGGRAPYPSTALMGVIAARSAGVRRVAVASPPGPGGAPDPAILAACEIAGADEVYAVGGAHAIAALAHGTETVDPVDVIAGPGGPWVQEAKLAVSRSVGIDGYAGPSELMVIADPSVPAGWLALDLCAQAEHGNDGLLVAAAADESVLAALAAEVDAVASRHPGVGDPPVALLHAPDLDACMRLADSLAPEHLQLSFEGAGESARSVRTAGCVLTGVAGATAFADYAAGSNHTLPTGGAGRFAGPLGPDTFRRPISIVEIGAGAARALAGVVETIAGAEGFALHAASARARVQKPGPGPS